jgi:four helix bundle protein
MNNGHCFGHQKLKVYNKSLHFLAVSDKLLKIISCKIAANGHLCRAAESIPRNIAYANSSWSPKERIINLGNANGSALECAACLDVFVAKQLLMRKDILTGKCLLREIVNMLIAIKKSAADRIREYNVDEYVADQEVYFSHEKFDVYKNALLFTGWIESISEIFIDTSSESLYTNLDKVSTGIVLNIAEGNGRFSSTDYKKFLNIAYKASIQASSLLDIVVSRDDSLYTGIRKDQKILCRIAHMITSLSHTIS